MPLSRACLFSSAPLFALALIGLAPPAEASPSLDDYKRFRALSIDLLGRMPTRDEVAAFEKGLDLDRWVDERLNAGAHVDRLTRTYQDLLRLETSGALLYVPANLLRRVKVLGPDKKEMFVYFRRGQRRARPETDGEFCMTEAETGLKVKMTNQLAPEGAAIPIDKKVLEAATTVVHPWWLYKDDRAASPSERFGDRWKPGSTYQPIRDLLIEPDGTPAAAIRVCREEAQTAEKGHVFLTGRDAPVPADTLGRQSPAPADSYFAKQHKGEMVSCRTVGGMTASAECGCGVGLEACLPGDANTKDPNGFVIPTHAALGVDMPFDEAPNGYSAWHKLWWSQEAARFFDRLFGEDHDFREVLTAKWTWVNGPLAQFYRFTAPSAAGGPAKGFSQSGTTEPLVDPAGVPDSLSPHDTDTWVRVENRGPHAAGIATTPAFLMKYASRRARGATLYTTFLCKPFVADKAKLAPSTEPDLRKRPGCASCHTTLEPLAAYFTRVVETDFTFLPESLFPADNDKCRADAKGKPPPFCGPFYDPAFTDAGRALLRGAYASLAHADSGPPGAAREITSSPDFASCAVERVAAAFLGRPLSPEDDDLEKALTAAFVQGGYRMKPLVRAVLRSDAYARSSVWSSSFLRSSGGGSGSGNGAHGENGSSGSGPEGGQP
jgi:hypothetical protein